MKDSIDRFDFDSHRDAIAYECKQVLAISLMMVDQFGYTKSSENGSNKSRVMKVLAENEQPSNEYLQKADEIISTIEAMDDTDAFSRRYDECKSNFVQRVLQEQSHWLSCVFACRISQILPRRSRKRKRCSTKWLVRHGLAKLENGLQLKSWKRNLFGA